MRHGCAGASTAPRRIVTRSGQGRRSAVLALALTAAACGAGRNDFDGDCDALGGPAAMVGMDPDSGGVLWERRVGDAVGVALSDGVLVGAGSSGAALGLDATSGELLWCTDLGSADQAGTTIVPGFAAASGVAATSVVGGDVVGLDPRTGAELWRTAVGQLEGLVVASEAGVFRVSDANAAARTGSISTRRPAAVSRSVWLRLMPGASRCSSWRVRLARAAR